MSVKEDTMSASCRCGFDQRLGISKEARDRAFETQRKVLAAVHLDSVFERATDARRVITQALRLQRRIERAERLGLDTGTIDRRSAEIARAQAMRQVNAARMALGDTVSSEKWRSSITRLDEAIRSADGQAILADTRDRRIHMIVTATNVEAADAEEMLRIWDAARHELNTWGINGLLSWLDGRFVQMRDMLQTTELGRQPHSPLSFWEWACLAVVAALTAAAVAACIGGVD
jgi:hypothetical protein